MIRVPAPVALLLAVVLTAGAILVPWLTLPTDPWFAAASAVRDAARPGDLVVLTPASRLDHLAAFDGLWAVTLNGTQLGRLKGFRRVFVVSESARRHVIAGYEEESIRHFGKLRVRLYGQAVKRAR